jgi:hypothetical protein
MSKLSVQMATNANNGYKFVEEVNLLEMSQSEHLVARELIDTLSRQSVLPNFQYNMSVEKLCEHFDASIERYLKLFMASHHGQDVLIALAKIRTAAAQLEQIRTNFKLKKGVALFDEAYHEDDTVKAGYVNIYVATVNQNGEGSLRKRPL